MPLCLSTQPARQAELSPNLPQSQPSVSLNMLLSSPKTNSQTRRSELARAGSPSPPSASAQAWPPGLSLVEQLHPSLSHLPDTHPFSLRQRSQAPSMRPLAAQLGWVCGRTAWRGPLASRSHPDVNHLRRKTTRHWNTQAQSPENIFDY